MKKHIMAILPILLLLSVGVATIKLSERHSPPFEVIYQQNGKQLIYIASKHTAELSSKTFKLIESTIKVYAPSLIIVEGVETNLGLSPKKVRMHIQKHCLPHWRCSENLYAAHIAQQQGIPFIGGEVSDQKIIDVLTKAGYTKQDVWFFYFTRQIPQEYQEGKVNSIESIKNYFGSFMTRYKVSGQNSFVDYQQWWQKKLGNELTFEALMNSVNTAPDSKGTYLQVLSAKINIVRNDHLLQTIQKAINAYSRVLVIYGASHYETLKKQLIHNLGKPTYHE